MIADEAELSLVAILHCFRIQGCLSVIFTVLQMPNSDCRTGSLNRARLTKGYVTCLLSVGHEFISQIQAVFTGVFCSFPELFSGKCREVPVLAVAAFQPLSNFLYVMCNSVSKGPLMTNAHHGAFFPLFPHLVTCGNFSPSAQLIAWFQFFTLK